MSCLERRRCLARVLWWVMAFVVATTGGRAAQEGTVRLPSDAADGGTLGVYLQWPDSPADDRYDDGAPVLVQMQGGASPGNLSSWADLVDSQGFVVVQFVYPGGEDQGLSSDGVYDYRGPVCALAARDVWLFALGRKTDDLGRTIHDVVGRTVLVENMGVSATSAGTMITPVVMSTYADDFVGSLRWVSFWENVGNDQVRTNELGRLTYDCSPNDDADGNGLANDEGKNPRYDPLSDYAYDEIQLDYSQLAWDPSETQTIVDQSGRFPTAERDGILFFDGNGNGLLDRRPLLRYCTDVDRNGLIDADEDYFINNPVPAFLDDGTPRLHYSRAATRYLEQNPAIFPNGVWPEWVATSAQADAFHQARTPNDYYHLLAVYAGSTRTISSFDQVPHFFVTADHAEAQIEQEGLAASGLWRRLQPDAAYYEAYHGALPPEYPDTPANITVPLGEMHLHAAPDNQTRSDLVLPTVMELADRTYYGGWPDDLTGTLDADGIPADRVEGLRFVDDSAMNWNAAAGNIFYDAARGSLDALEEVGGEIRLGALFCIEEDDTQLDAVDGDRPDVGSAWFYVVRPNGLGGSYGSSSGGAPRQPGGEDCLH